MNDHKLFTSESVGEGHPDKLCDQISDAVLDACLRDDPKSHVACETFASTALILIGGEITTSTFVDIQQTARNIAREIGYTDSAFGLDCNSMAVLSMIHAQSPDIAQGVNGEGLSEYHNQMGAGDQGMMFGYACKETPELMPAPIMYAHKLLRKASQLRKSKEIDWLRPDAKSQVTVEYEGDKPVRIDTVVISHQHAPEISYGSLKEAIIEKIIKPVLEPTGLLDAKTKFFINPTGRFVIGGPFGDTGLTGRKIIVDTYGGMGRHGALCRKEYRCGRSCRTVRIAARLCDRCTIPRVNSSRFIRYRKGSGECNRKSCSASIRSQSRRDYRNARFVQTYVSSNRRLRALRPLGIQLGKNR